MKLISTLIKKFQKSSSRKNQKPTTSDASEPTKNIWSHNEPSNFDEKLKKYESRQKKIEEENEIRKDRRTLRRQNRFLGFHNDVLALQNQRLSSEKHHLKMERQEMTEKKNEIAKRLRKQKRISEYYRRKLAEMQEVQKMSE